MKKEQTYKKVPIEKESYFTLNEWKHWATEKFETTKDPMYLCLEKILSELKETNARLAYISKQQEIISDGIDLMNDQLSNI